VQAGKGDARRIGSDEVALVRQRVGGGDLDLSGTGLRVKEQGFFFGDARRAFSMTKTLPAER